MGIFGFCKLRDQHDSAVGDMGATYVITLEWERVVGRQSGVLKQGTVQACKPSMPCKSNRRGLFSFCVLPQPHNACLPLRHTMSSKCRVGFTGPSGDPKRYCCAPKLHSWRIQRTTQKMACHQPAVHMRLLGRTAVTPCFAAMARSTSNDPKQPR
jgi:hypothetical protein